jgi:hypothetical protein
MANTFAMYVDVVGGGGETLSGKSRLWARAGGE